MNVHYEKTDSRFDLGAHPCFNREARMTHARIHLPVAPKCNMQCNYCDRRFNCVNESRPGVSCVTLSPLEALRYLERLETKMPKPLSVVGIAGPGDPFANPEETLETLRLVRRTHPEMLLCLATNGLGLLPYVGELAALGVSHVTITINAVEPAIGAKVYSWLECEGMRLKGIEAAKVLWERQRLAITALRAFGILVKVNSILMPGINDKHIPELARTVAKLGANILNIMPLMPLANTPFAAIPEPGHCAVGELREEAGRFLPQMAHCMRCRADAAGLLHEPLPLEDVLAAKAV